jgi:molybdenum cofactor cytidylyltransferase
VIPRLIQGILLAAGSGRRFGADKLLQPLPDGRPLVLAALTALAAGVATVVAVVRPEQRALRDLLGGQGGVQICPCPRSAAGMGHSIACGVAATPEADGWLIALGDMPFVRPATVQAVAAALAEGAPIAAPVHGGRRGHPVGFDRRFRADLLALSGDQGARAVLEGSREGLVEVAVDDPGVLVDIDRPLDLAAWRGHA